MKQTTRRRCGHLRAVPAGADAGLEQGARIVPVARHRRHDGDRAVRNAASSRCPPRSCRQLQQQYLERGHATLAPGRRRQPADAATSASPARPGAATRCRAFAAAVYLLNARTLLGMAEAVEADEKTTRPPALRGRAVDGARRRPATTSPSTPRRRRRRIETQGESIAKGIQNLLHDVQQGHVSHDRRERVRGRPQRRHHRRRGGVRERAVPADRIQAAHRQGLRAAVAAGAAVHQQVLHPRPAARELADPLRGGAGPPRLRGELAQPRRRRCATTTWDDYIEDAAIKAIDVVQEITGSEQINTLGFCVGGTILAHRAGGAGGARRAAGGQRDAADHACSTSPTPACSTSSSTRPSVQFREMQMGKGGLLKGQELASTFSFLRPNDLVWNYVVGNYLKGETPPPFDLLYWNSDAHQPAGPDVLLVPAQHLPREQARQARQALTVCGEKVDLGKHRRAGLHLRLARGPHRAVGRRLRVARRC